MIVGTQSYTWYQAYQEAQGKPLSEHWDEILAQVAEAGCQAFENTVDAIATPELAEAMGRLLAKHGLTMPSVYAGSRLHDERWEESVTEVLERAQFARQLGATVLVTNPQPLPQDKTDAELRIQAKALDILGRELRGLGLRLAFHNHSVEMRASAREFHHMLLGTDPAHVGLCLDTHWIYRGAGNSEVALYDIVQLYGARIASLHLRQSRHGIWTQSLCAGDIDYSPLVASLRALRFDGPLIMEQAVEVGTPRDLPAVERERLSRQWVRAVFGV
jgi:inosose dehydratase